MAIKTLLRAAQKISLMLLPLLLASWFVIQPVTTAAETAEKPSEPVPQERYPGLDRLVPMATELTSEAANIEQPQPGGEALNTFKRELAEQQSSYQQIASQMSASSDESKTVSQMLKVRNWIEALRNEQDNQLAKLSESLKTLEEQRTRWETKQDYWKNWLQSLALEQEASARDTFEQARQTIDTTLQRINSISAELLSMQQEIFNRQEQIIAWEAQLEDALDTARQKTFKRNAHALFNPEFYEQLNDDMWIELKLNLEGLFVIPAGYLQAYGWIPMLLAVIFIVIAGLLHYRTRRKEEIHEDWAFLFRHPLAGGLFIALFIGGMMLPSPIVLWRWGLIILGTLSATVLITAMLNRPRLRRVIMVLAGLFIVSETLRTIGLPQPLYRLYLVVVCITATPLCYFAAKRQIVRNEGKPDLLAVAFYFGTAVGVAGLITQVFGFATLTANLIDATLGTVFIMLFAHMALHLGEGGIGSFLNAEWVRERNFIQQLGKLTESRIKTFLRFIVYIYTLLSLAVIWKIAPSIDNAWQSFMSISFSYGEFELSLETVFLVICILYLAIIFSWVLQATLDTQVLTPRGMDLGVRDSIKRLLHYTLVLVGFIVALSIAGIEIEKFAILVGALGVGIGFGLQNIVNNFISGLILLFERPVKVGDTINIDDQWGTITKIGLRSTIFETLDRSEIIVPNSDLISQKVTNWTLSSKVSRIVLPVGVAYGSPLEKVIELLLGVARENPDVMNYPEASAIFTGFGESSIDFELRVWIVEIKERLRIKSELGIAIDHALKDAGITIPFPQRDLHLRSIESDLQTPQIAVREPSTKDDKDS